MSPYKSSFWPTRPPQHSCWSLSMNLAPVCFRICPKFLKVSRYMRNRGFSICVKKLETLQRNLVYPQIQLHGLSECCLPGFCSQGLPPLSGTRVSRGLSTWRRLSICRLGTQLGQLSLRSSLYAASSWYDVPHSRVIIIEFPRIWT